MTMVCDFMSDADVVDAQAIAEALALLNASMAMNEARREELDQATDALNVALETAVEARERYAASGNLVLDAARLVALVKGARV